MSLRTRLVVAFFALAVVPLALIVGATYVSSLRAYRRAVAEETAREALRLRERVGIVSAGISGRLAQASRLPLVELARGESQADEREVAASVAAQMRELEPLIEGLQFVPAENRPGFAIRFEAPEPDRASAADSSVAAQRRVVVVVPEVPAPPAPPSQAPDPKTLDPLVAEAMESAARARSAAIRLEQRARREAFDVAREHATAERLERLRARSEESRRLLGEDAAAPVWSGTDVVGHLVAQVSPRQLLASIAGVVDRSSGEIPFAKDPQGQLWAPAEDDERILREAGIGAAGAAPEGWVVVTADKAEGELVFGVARPLGPGLQAIRLAAARNLAAGLALIALATLGILPLSARLSREVREVATAAEALAAGDPAARARVSGSGEVGQLAAAFNHMAEELDTTQRRLLEQQLRERLLAAENERKSAELETARRFQLSLLPSSLPEHPDVELGVLMRTATEVGGDYYDFRAAARGDLVIAVGDATGHGARAGTMVTMVKALFTASEDVQPAAFLAGASRAVRRMGLSPMMMALVLLRISGRRVRFSSAGMPPLLLYRAAGGTVEELALPGMPLGGFDDGYRERDVTLAPGDTLLVMSDGLAELLDGTGAPLGYERAVELLAAVGDRSPDAIVAALGAAAERWKGGAPPEDDVTLLVVKARAEA